MKPLTYVVAALCLICSHALYAADDPALTPPVINTEPGPKYADATRIFQGIPGIELAANGRLWALWYAGGPDEPSEGPGNYVVLVTSADDGKTWSGPKLVIDPPGPVRAYDPCLWHSPDGRLWLFWAQSYQWWDGRSGVWAIVTENSGDEAPRWSPPRRLCNGIMMNKPTVLSTGQWLLPASVWQRPADARTDAGHRHDLGQENGANVHVSRDKGETWSLLGQAQVPKRVFDEHMIVERHDGSLWMLVRAAYGIGESTSTDRGKTWSPGRESTIPHVNARFFIRRLKSGKLLLVTHQPPDKKTRSHLIAHLSDDDGKTWHGGLMIDERVGVSYPDGVQAPDGAIYLIYDFLRTGQKQILMATFTEDDVAEGKWSSSNARQRVLVNQATGQRQATKAVVPMKAILATTTFLSMTAAVLAADDLADQRLQNWHQWRGPQANGVAPLGNPPVEWSQTKNIKWKVQIPGEGSSTPIVWGDKLFVLTAIMTDRTVDSIPIAADQPKRPFGIVYPRNFYKFDVLCLDRNTGAVVWQRTANEVLPHEGVHPDNDFASASPTTDGTHLYVSFGSRGIYCYDLEGNLVWKRDLGQMQTRLSFGEGTSPVIHGDSLVINWDHDGDSFITVLDARTGETRWKAERDELSGWSTPLVVEHNGRTQVVVNGSNRVRSYDLATGELIWQCGGQVRNITPSPVTVGGLVYCMSGYSGSAMFAIPLDSAGDLTDTGKVAWQQNRNAPYVPSPLLYGDRLYFNKSNSAILFCADAKTGNTLLDGQRLPGLANLYASPVGAAGRIYITARDGTTLVIRDSPEFEVLATNTLTDPTDASPAIAGHQLFLRGQKFLYCIEELGAR